MKANRVNPSCPTSPVPEGKPCHDPRATDAHRVFTHRERLEAHQLAGEQKDYQGVTPPRRKRLSSTDSASSCGDCLEVMRNMPDGSPWTW